MPKASRAGRRALLRGCVLASTACAAPRPAPPALVAPAADPAPRSARPSPAGASTLSYDVVFHGPILGLAVSF